MRRLVVLIALPLVLLGLAGVPAGASSTVTCNSTMSGSIASGVNVPNGDICSLDGATVSGNVTVAKNGGLIITDGSAISGSVTSGVAASFQPASHFGNSGYPAYNGSVWICGSTVQGGVQDSGSTDQLTVGDGSSQCPGNQIDGSITATGVKGGVEVVNNQIYGSVTITKTRGCPSDECGVPKSVEVVGNTIYGNLACSKNASPPPDAHNNTVSLSDNCLH